jgi:hypothetical protein
MGLSKGIVRVKVKNWSNRNPPTASPRPLSSELAPPTRFTTKIRQLAYFVLGGTISIGAIERF